MKKSNSLLEIFGIFMGENLMIQSGEKTLLAVSGGMDSMVLADLFSKSGFDFGIAHCNFSLRGTESDRDEEFVKNISANSKKPFHVIRFETEKYANEKKYSIQEAARELRYDWFNKISEEYGYQKIATAHHLDDSIETFFINLLRGTGPAGLRGISAVHGKIIRPLLFARKKEIENYIRDTGITYREDSSNASDDYLRNRLRHHLIPILRENSEAFEDKMTELMNEMSFIHSYVMAKTEEWKEKNMTIDEEGNYILPIKAILLEDKPESFLATILYTFGIKGVDCSKVLNAKTPGKIFNSRNFSVLRDRENLILNRIQEKPETHVIIPELPVKFTSGKKRISIHSEEQDDSKRGILTANVQHISGDNLTFPLTLRSWQPGDFFIPLGMQGRKKISDFFTDIKLNRFEKDKTLLLLSGKNIVCILGLRIDERYKITPSTKQILTIEVSEI